MFPSLETGKSKLEVSTDSVSCEDSVSGLSMTAFLLCAHLAFLQCVCRERASWLVSLLFSQSRHKDSIIMISTNSNYLPAATAPNVDTITFEFRALTHEFGWIGIQSVTWACTN